MESVGLLLIFVDDDDIGRASLWYELHRERHAVVGVERFPEDVGDLISITDERHEIRLATEGRQWVAVSGVRVEAISETPTNVVDTEQVTVTSATPNGFA